MPGWPSSRWVAEAPSWPYRGSASRQSPLHQQKSPGHFLVRYIFIPSCIMCFSWSDFIFAVCFILFVCFL
jgi:hypothetical protein